MFVGLHNQSPLINYAIGPIRTRGQNWNCLDKIEGQILSWQVVVLSAVSALKFSKRASSVNSTDYISLLYSWRFSHYSVPNHWLVHGRMTSNNEIVYRQMQWGGNIAKTMTSNGKQFTVTHEMLTAVARDQRVQMKVDDIARISARFSRSAFVLFITNHIMTGPLGNSELCSILGKRNSLLPSRPVIKCYILYHARRTTFENCNYVA